MQSFSFMHTGRIISRLWLLVTTTFAANFLSPAIAQTSPITGWGRNDYGQSSAPATPTEVVAVGAGYYHSVGLNRDGTVFAWGRDNFTQLQIPPTLSGVAAISAGDFHTLALRSNGTVVAWGRNNSNQTNVPSGLSTVIAISAGSFHNLALKTNGLVTAWGSGTQTNVPLTLSNVVAIAAGGAHSLALRADGIVVAWGNNLSNQTNVPAALSNVVAVAAGGLHSLALKDDGTISAWGTGTATNVPAGLSNVVAIAAGATHSLALHADGTVIGWGGNSYTQTNTPAGLGGVTAIAVGQGDSLALVGNGAPWFGSAIPYRQVLAGSSVTFSVPVTGEMPLSWQWQCNGTNLPARTNLFLTLTNVQMAQAGNYRLTATNAWGGAVSADMTLTVLPFRFLSQPQPLTALLRGDANFSAQLDGQGPFTNQWLFNGNPLAIGTNATLTLTGVQWTNAGLYSVRVSNRHGTLISTATALGVTPVAVWGYNSSGQTNVPAGLSNLVMVAAGTSHVLGLKRDGTVTAWGKYEYGANPVQVPAGLTNVVGLAAGNSFSLALKNDGTVVAWWDYVTAVTNLPSGLTNVVAVAAGYDKAMALRADGSVLTWGTSVALPEGLGPIVQIASGGSHFLAVRSEGTVVAWGDNIYGQTNVPPDLTNAISVAGSLYHSVATKADGTVIAWGANASGQTNVPAVATNTLSVSAGGVHTATRSSGGTVVVWGGAGTTNTPADLRGVASMSAGLLFTTALVGDGPPWFPPTAARYVGLAGMNAALLAQVSGAMPMTFQWQWNGTNLPGATNALLTLTNLAMNQGGTYRLLASNSFGSATSPDILLTTAPMRIHFQPHNQTVVSGQAAALAVSLDGQGPFAYKWFHDGLPVAGGTNDTLNFKTTTWTDAGQYVVVVTNSFGSVTSTAAELRVIPVVAWGNGDYVSTAPRDLTNAIAVAAGGGRVIAAKRNGLPAVWDANGNGGWLTNFPAATTNTVAVAAGSYHFLALQTNGTVRGWADPIYGGSEANPPADLTNAVAIAAGGSHSLALRADGHIVAFGSDYYGQSRYPSNLDNVVAIADGGYHSLALRGDGRVVAWGLSDSGQANVPVDLTNAIAIAAGDDQSLALRADGSVTIWGYNSIGATNLPAGLSNLVAVAGGYVHDVALRADGRVVTWGLNTSGQTNVPAWIGSDFVALACGTYHSAALEGNGPPFIPPVVRSRNGLLGLTTYLYTPAMGGRPLSYQWQFCGTNIPAATNALLTLSNLASNQIGNYHVVVTNAWGTAVSDDINVGAEALRVTASPANTRTHLSGVLSLNAVVEGKGPLSYQWLFNGQPIAGQTNVTLNLSGLVWTNEGSYSLRISNAFGTVTSAAATLQLSPLVAPFGDPALQTNLPAGLRGIIAVATGGNSFLAIRSNRTVIAWGDNPYGQTNVPAGLVNVVAVSMSYAHCLALRADGSVVAWGRNDVGQTNVPAGLSNVVAIAAGAVHSLALKADGTVAAWGAADAGGPTDVPVDLTNVVAIAVGSSFSLALKADGTAVAWGTYWSGNGGYPTMTVPAELRDAVAIGTGTDHGLAVNSSGSVAAWGAVFHNQTLVPSNLTNAVAVSGNYLSSLALRSDSTVIGWGVDSYAPQLAPEVTNVVALAEGGWLGLIGDGAPYFSPRLSDRSGTAGATVFLNQRANGQRPIAYQWWFNGTALAGATNPLLGLRNFSPHQAGTYGLTATNTLGSVSVTNVNVRFNGYWLGAEPGTNLTQFKLGVFGPTNARCSVVVSTNLVNWTELQQLTNNGQIQIIADTTAGRSKRFYRLLISTNAP